MKRTRQVPQNVRDKISATLKGRQLTTAHKQAISQGQRAAWARVPKTMQDLWPSSETENKSLTDNENA